MKRNEPAIARDDSQDAFDTEEVPTRPGEPPPGTQAWPTRKPRGDGSPLRTATSKFRALTAVALHGGIGRESLVDAEEMAEPPPPPKASGTRLVAASEPELAPDLAPPPAPASAPAPVTHRLPPGPRGTVRMAARGDTGPTGTVRMRARLALPARTVALVARLAPRPRRWLSVLSAAVMCTMLAGLTAASSSPDATTAPPVEPVAVVPAVPDPEPVVAEPPTDTPSAATAPPKTAPPPKRAVPPRAGAARSRPHNGASVF
jgi:hypothetical protein